MFFIVLTKLLSNCLQDFNSENPCMQHCKRSSSSLILGNYNLEDTCSLVLTTRVIYPHT